MKLSEVEVREGVEKRNEPKSESNGPRPVQGKGRHKSGQEQPKSGPRATEEQSRRPKSSPRRD